MQKRLLICFCVFALLVTFFSGLSQAAEETAQNSGQYSQEDSQLAQTLIALYEHWDVLCWSSVRTSGQGYLQGVPQKMYDYQMKLQQAVHYLSEMETKDDLRKNLIAKVLEAGKLDLAASENYIKATVMGQKAKDYNEECNDIFNRGIAFHNLSMETCEGIKGDLKTLYGQSDAFRRSLPRSLVYNTGIEPRPSSFMIGTYNLVTDPFRFLLVGQSSFAAEIGLKEGDRIISANGKRMDPTGSIEDFKMIIQENLGKTIEVTLERGGKEQTLQMKIPDAIPQKFLY